MSGVTTTYSSVAAITEFGRSERVTAAAAGAYTCPVGFTAKVRGSMNLDAIGADATYAIAVMRGATFYPVGAHVAVNGISVIAGYVILHQHDMITLIGDDGSTNGTGDIDVTIQEIQQ